MTSLRANPEAMLIIINSAHKLEPENQNILKITKVCPIKDSLF